MTFPTEDTTMTKAFDAHCPNRAGEALLARCNADRALLLGALCKAPIQDEVAYEAWMLKVKAIREMDHNELAIAASEYRAQYVIDACCAISNCKAAWSMLEGYQRDVMDAIVLRMGSPASDILALWAGAKIDPAYLTALKRIVNK
jgi:L-arabinose isomerase